MKIILRFIVFVATIVGVVALLLGGIFLGTGNLDFLESTGLVPDLGALRTAPSSDAVEQDTTSETGTATVLRFTWRGDEIVHDGNAISEADFALLLVEAEANGTKVEIVKYSDVRVEAADRWRKLLDEAGVRYEVIPQE